MIGPKVPKVRSEQKPLCKHDGCSSTMLSKGLCNKHYLRARVNGLVPTGARAELKNDMLTLAKRLLVYSEQSGNFTWVVDWYSAKAGDTAGNVGANGYVVIGLKGKDVYAHRLAWAFVHGEMPKMTIDHKDGNRANNRISNLRDVPLKVNCQNSIKARRIRQQMGTTL